MFALCSTSPSSRAGPWLGAKEPLGSTNLAPSSSGVKRVLPSRSSTGPSLSDPILLAELWEHPWHDSHPARPATPGESCPSSTVRTARGMDNTTQKWNSFSPLNRTGEEFRSRGKGLACAWSKSGAGPGAPRLSGHHRALPAHQHRQRRKVVLSNTGLTAWLHHLQSMWWLFPEGVTSQEPARPGPVPERLPKSSPVLPPAASSTELFPACSSW